jgi:hypothetical protein
MCTIFWAALKKMVGHLDACWRRVMCVENERSHVWPLGTGAVYSFDPVGSYEREACRAAGAAQALVQPFLDNQVSVIAITRFTIQVRAHGRGGFPFVALPTGGIRPFTDVPPRAQILRPTSVHHRSQADPAVDRYTSRTRHPRPAPSSPNTYLSRQCLKSLSTRLLALLSGISR